MNYQAATFTADQIDHIEALRQDLQARLRWPVETEVGATDCGSEQWAALVVTKVPKGSYGLPGPLVSIVTTGDVSGAVGVMEADGRVVDWAEIPEAVETAEVTGVLAWNAMVQ